MDKENTQKHKAAVWFKRTDIYRNRGRYLLVLPALLFIIIFSYFPMVGLVMAFEEYDPIAGMFASRFVGIENFKFFFHSSQWIQVTVNTIYLNALFIGFGTLVSIILAVMLSEIRKGVFLKVSQTFMTLPHFVSWGTVALFSLAFTSSNGIVNQIAGIFGVKVNFATDPGVWPAFFVIMRIWKGAGWTAIIYMAAILGIDAGIYEAARIDGCSKFKCIFKITLPLIKHMIILLFIMSIGHIFNGDFGMIYPFVGDNSMLYPTTNVIDTLVFRAVRSETNFGKTAAVGLYQSVMGFFMVLLANGLAKRYAPSSALF
jgi:putative aldouronate transport system permease protein